METIPDPPRAEPRFAQRLKGNGRRTSSSATSGEARVAEFTGDRAHRRSIQRQRTTIAELANGWPGPSHLATRNGDGSIDDLVAKSARSHTEPRSVIAAAIAAGLLLAAS